ncbi:MAG: HAD-IA family hydrolase [Anaerolineaceae bacterium]|nr:HAD-IA family hydrolase [Anaerolineaceae bacterium]
MIKAICFDADGVLINPQMQFARHLQDVYGIAREMTAPFYNGVFNECLTGQKELADVLPPFLESWGWQKGVDEFIRTWMLEDDVVDGELLNKVRRLRNQGLVCCLTTNQEHNRATYMRNQMGFANEFDHLFFSCEMGGQKPEDAYYQQIETTLALAPHEILFWDDSQRNVDAARKRGWQAEIYSSYEDFDLKMVAACGESREDL